MRSFLIAANHATNSVAASTAVSLASATLPINGILVPATSVATFPAVLVLELTTGATPGAFDFEVEQSATSGGTYTDIQALDESTAIPGVSMYNVTIDSSKPYIRVNISDATANAGTVTAYLLIG